MRSHLKWFLEAVQSHNSDECLVWPFAVSPKGYGEIRFEGRRVYCHRLAFKLAHGRWPEPCACHRCDVRACINFRHIFEGTVADNQQDAMLKGRMAQKLTPEMVRSIRAEYVPHEVGLWVLARKYGVSAAAISMIIHRKWWPHV